MTIKATTTKTTTFHGRSFWPLSCWWHQATKPRILFSPICSTKFSQLEQLKKEANFLLVQSSFFSQVWTNEKFMFFLVSKNQINFREKIGENKIRGYVVWCHEQDTLSDQRRSYNYCTRKMNGDVRLLKRGASVAQLQSPSRFQPEPIPMLAFEELSFAENFTSSARVGLIWKISLSKGAIF